MVSKGLTPTQLGPEFKTWLCDLFLDHPVKTVKILSVPASSSVSGI